MKNLSLYLTIIALASGVRVVCAQTEPMGIINVTLNPFRIVSVPTHPHVTTTIVLPAGAVLDGYDGVAFSNKPEPGADYLLLHEPGKSYLSITPMSTEVPARNLTVEISGEIYTLYAFATKRAGDAWVQLRLMPKEEQGPSKDVTALVSRLGRPAQKTEKEPSRRRLVGIHEELPRPESTPVTPERLISLMDLGKMLMVLTEKDIAQLVRLNPTLKVSVRENDIWDSGPLKIQVHRVLGNDSLDALVICFDITNMSERRLALAQDNASVKVGSHYYRPAMMDIVEELEPRQRAQGYLIIVGDALGRKAMLSVENEFIVSLVAGGANE